MVQVINTVPFPVCHGKRNQVEAWAQAPSLLPVMAKRARGLTAAVPRRARTEGSYTCVSLNCTLESNKEEEAVALLLLLSRFFSIATHKKLLLLLRNKEDELEEVPARGVDGGVLELLVGRAQVAHQVEHLVQRFPVWRLGFRFSV